MPAMQTTLHGLNASFGPGNVANAAGQQAQFAHGAPYQQTLANMGSSDPVLNRALREYLKKMPGGISETLRSAIHYALGTTPPTNVTFAWAPSYDWEITVWQAPDTAQTKGGITILIKSRYPDDAHPLGG
jgi:hypothetical protein